MKATVSSEWVGKDLDDLASQIGERAIRKPWCAKVSLNRLGFSREFIKGKIDYTKSNSKQSRGVMVWFVLQHGYVYELKRNLSWKSSKRIFMRVLENGAIEEGSKQDAEKWLSNPSE